jgi:acyl carrier protein
MAMLPTTEDPMTERTDTETRVHKLLVEHLGVDPEKVTPDAALVDDLGADSLDIVEVELAVEEEFGFEFPDTEGTIPLDATVARVVELVDQHRKPA